MALARTVGNEVGAVQHYARSWLLLGIAAVVFCAGCGCDSDGTEASIEITKPATKPDEVTELTYEDDDDPDRAGFQYTVSAYTENIDIETAVELLIDDKSFDPQFISYTDEDGLLRFANVTLPDGTHELKAGTPTGSVYSDSVAYVLYNLVIESPADGVTLYADSNGSEEGLRADVEVNVYGFDKGQKIVLTVTDEDDHSETYDEKTGDSAEDEMVLVTFESVTLPYGEVTLSASAELDKDKTAESLPHKVTVARESGPVDCPDGSHEENGVCVRDDDGCPVGSHKENGFCVRDESCAADGSSCNDHGECDDDDGVITCSDCDDGYTGDFCDECDTRADDPCGDHGQCNDNNRSAMCVCDPGYAGDDCTDCAPGFHLSSSSCVLDSQCLDTTCNGHGDCSVVDGVVSCSDCDEGYEGTFCHECDEDASDPCGDHGSCDDASGTAVCDCSTGYAGDDCDKCANGFNNHGTSSDPVCDVSCDLADLDCGPGECDDESGPAACDCTDTGFSGASCNVCADDAFENNDADTSAKSLSETSFFSAEAVICGVDDDWYRLDNVESGSTIEVEIGFTHADGNLNLELWYEYSDPFFNRRAAFSYSFDDDERVVYTVPQDKGGLYLIRVRSLDFTPNTRNTYSLFVDVRIGSTCLANESCDPNPCQHGAGCSPDNDGDGLVQCGCSVEYTGDKCESCAPGYHDDSGNCVADATCLTNTCAEHGTCSEGTPPTCVCNTEYSGVHCESCASGFYRSMGGACLEPQSCDGVTCGSHGSCDNSDGPARCICDAGYIGEYCDQCAAGYHDDSGFCVADTDCIVNSCGRHGSCDPGEPLSACECDPSYSGDNCERCAAGYYSSCHTCQSLGVECGTWDDGCGGTVTCGPCAEGTACHEYWGVCADSVCDLYDTGCCDVNANARVYCSGTGVPATATCASGRTCGWLATATRKAGGFLTCVSSNPPPQPPDDRIPVACEPEWLP